MRKIFLTEKIDQTGIDILEKIGTVTIGSNIEEDTIIKEAQGCEAILIRSAKITRKVMESIPTLKTIAKHGIGVDNIDLVAAKDNGIKVLNAPEANVNAVAEHALTMILACCKNIVFTDSFTRKGEFKKRNEYPNMELKGKTVGFIGMGKIATLLEHKLRGLGVDVMAFDPGKSEIENGILVKDLDELYKKADIITVHVPLLPSTKGLLNKESFGKMKDGVVVINTSRGGIIDEDALYEALISKKVRIAGLDVFEQEPPSKYNPLFELDNIIVTPHNAALTHEALIAMASDAAQGISDYLTGKEPEFVVSC